jgi:hypothetical protein
MLETKFLEKTKHTFHVHCFRKWRLLRDNEEKYSRLRDATDDIIPRMSFACWIIKATNTHSEYVILFALTPQQCSRECASVYL